ncbi:MAG: DUF3616 domain-containing protein [Planctomycetes bacterium]|nr:DUF3616 domain-containing protein [Planctomycetota bacterium]
MKPLNIAILIVVLFSGWCSAGRQEFGGDIDLVFHGASDASGAVSLGKDMFIVADDENNTLRVYRTKDRTRAISSFDVSKFLGTTSVHPEADIEGATRVGDTVYWITSHGRNKDGKIRPNRYRFFATTVKRDGDKVTIEPVGYACRNLMHKLVETTKSWELKFKTRFNEKLKKSERKQLAPKVNGLNIEGLCISHDKKVMYIGFRNRGLVSGSLITRAMVVPLINYKEVIEKKAEPVFGEILQWRLTNDVRINGKMPRYSRGLYIRSMEYSDAHKTYFIVAGPYDSLREFVLYKWSGKKIEQPKAVRRIETKGGKFTPEALIPFEGSKKLLLLSDDGSYLCNVTGPADCAEDEFIDGGKCPNKYLTNENQKFFRGIWITP